MGIFSVNIKVRLFNLGVLVDNELYYSFCLLIFLLKVRLFNLRVLVHSELYYGFCLLIFLLFINISFPLHILKIDNCVNSLQELIILCVTFFLAINQPRLFPDFTYKRAIGCCIVESKNTFHGFYSFFVHDLFLSIILRLNL